MCACFCWTWGSACIWRRARKLAARRRRAPGLYFNSAAVAAVLWRCLPSSRLPAALRSMRAFLAGLLAPSLPARLAGRGRWASSGRTAFTLRARHCATALAALLRHVLRPAACVPLRDAVWTRRQCGRRKRAADGACRSLLLPRLAGRWFLWRGNVAAATARRQNICLRLTRSMRRQCGTAASLTRELRRLRLRRRLLPAACMAARACLPRHFLRTTTGLSPPARMAYRRRKRRHHLACATPPNTSPRGKGAVEQNALLSSLLRAQTGVSTLSACVRHSHREPSPFCTRRVVYALHLRRF